MPASLSRVPPTAPGPTTTRGRLYTTPAAPRDVSRNGVPVAQARPVTAVLVRVSGRSSGRGVTPTATPSTTMRAAVPTLRGRGLRRRTSRPATASQAS